MITNKIIQLIKTELETAKEFYIENIEKQDFNNEEICDAYYNNGYYEALNSLLLMIDALMGDHTNAKTNIHTKNN